MLIDTHAHLDFKDYAEDLSEVLARAQGAGVSKIITISTTLESCQRAVDLANRHSMVRAAVGIHPLYVDESADGFLGLLREFAKLPNVCAIGETGIGSTRTLATQPKQAGVFLPPATRSCGRKRAQRRGTSARLMERLSGNHPSLLRPFKGGVSLLWWHP